MDYNINDVAVELMVEPQELKEIYQIFFQETSRILTGCEAAQNQMDWDTLSKLFHALKGSASNLRMSNISSLSEKLEEGAKFQRIKTIENLLPVLHKACQDIQDQIERYYRS